MMTEKCRCILPVTRDSGEFLGICIAFKESYIFKSQGLFAHQPDENLFQGCWQTEVIFQAVGWNFPLSSDGEDKKHLEYGSILFPVCSQWIAQLQGFLSVLLVFPGSFHFGD